MQLQGCLFSALDQTFPSNVNLRYYMCLDIVKELIILIIPDRMDLNLTQGDNKYLNKAGE